MQNKINKQWYVLALVVLTGYLVYLLSPNPDTICGGCFVCLPV